MQRAVGGAQNLPAQSPAVILAAVLERRGLMLQEHTSWELLGASAPAEAKEATPGSAAGPQSGGVGVGSGNGSVREVGMASVVGAQQQQQGGSFYDSFELAGEGIATRLGFGRRDTRTRATPGPAGAGAAARAGLLASPPHGDSAAVASSAVIDRGAEALLRELTLDDVRRLPPTFLLSSCADTTVPFWESAELYWLLHDCGVPAKHLVYHKVSHGDFVVGWHAAVQLGGTAGGAQGAAAAAGDLSGFAADLLAVVSGQVELDWIVH